MSQAVFNLKDGEYEKEVALQKVTENAEYFIREMRAVAKRFALEFGTVTTDDLRRYAAGRGLRPHHPGAWGAIFNTKQWVPTGYTHTTIASSHARPIRIWKLK